MSKFFIGMLIDRLIYEIFENESIILQSLSINIFEVYEKKYFFVNHSD